MSSSSPEVYKSYFLKVTAHLSGKSFVDWQSIFLSCKRSSYCAVLCTSPLTVCCTVGVLGRHSLSAHDISPSRLTPPRLIIQLRLPTRRVRAPSRDAFCSNFIPCSRATCVYTAPTSSPRHLASSTLATPCHGVTLPQRVFSTTACDRCVLRVLPP